MHSELCTHVDVTLGHSGCAHAAACPNRPLWDCHGMAMHAHLCVTVLVKDGPAQGMQLIALCEWVLTHK